MAPRKEPTMKDAVWPIDKIVPYAANASEAATATHGASVIGLRCFTG